MGKCPALHVCACPWLYPAPRAAGLASPGHRARHGCWDDAAMPRSILPCTGGWNCLPSGAALACITGLASWSMAREDGAVFLATSSPQQMEELWLSRQELVLPMGFCLPRPAAAASSGRMSGLRLPSSLLKGHPRSHRGRCLHLCLSGCEGGTLRAEDWGTYSAITFAASRRLVCQCAVCALLKALNLKLCIKKQIQTTELDKWQTCWII